MTTQVADTKFDDFKVWDGFPREQHGRRWRSSAATSLDTGTGILTVNYKDHGGEVVFTGHGDDDYMAEVDINLNSGTDGSIYFRYLDPDNWYRAVIRSTGIIKLEEMLLGRVTPTAPDAARMISSSPRWCDQATDAGMRSAGCS